MTEGKEMVQLIRRVAADTFWEIFQTELMPTLNDYIGMKTEAVRTKTAEPPEKDWNWDPQKIAWSKAQGTKGEYERSEDVNSLDFKAMLKDLAEHKGNLTRDGIFYWTFKNGSTVGRKQKG